MITIDLRSRIPIYEQITSSIKELVVKEVLKPGEKLPSVRDLAKEMTINPNTIQKSYQELERQGIIYTIRGKGTFISENIKVTNQQLKRDNLNESLRKLIVEAKYLNISNQEFLNLVDHIYEELLSKEVNHD